MDLSQPELAQRIRIGQGHIPVIELRLRQVGCHNADLTKQDVMLDSSQRHRRIGMSTRVLCHFQQIGIRRPAALGVAVSGPIASTLSGHGHGFEAVLIDVVLLLSCVSAGFIFLTFVVLLCLRGLRATIASHINNSGAAILFEILSATVIASVYYFSLFDETS